MSPVNRDAGARLVALAFAAEDLSADLGVGVRDENGAFNPLLADVQCRLAIAAAAAKVPAIETPFPDHRYQNGLVAESRLAASLGFAGKLYIHPALIEPVNNIFMPSSEQIEWARSVLHALDGSARGIAVVAGKMVGKAHLRLAERILAKAIKTDD